MTAISKLKDSQPIGKQDISYAKMTFGIVSGNDVFLFFWAVKWNNSCGS